MRRLAAPHVARRRVEREVGEAQALRRRLDARSSARRRASSSRSAKGLTR
jgi:hypothetical protein